MEVKITFKDGTEINATMNGNCYITKKEPSFPEDIGIVTVAGTDYEQIFHSARVQPCASVDGKYWFTFTEESEEEKTIRELREQNQMLEDAVVELAELIGGGE